MVSESGDVLENKCLCVQTFAFVF